MGLVSGSFGGSRVSLYEVVCVSGPDRGNKGGVLQYTVGETFRLWFIMILQYIMILL